MNKQAHPNSWLGMFGGFVAIVAASAPAWVAVHTAITFLTGVTPSTSYLSHGIIFGIALLSVIALLTLAYRMLTGRGRKQDGGLIGPTLLILFSLALLSVSGFVLWLVFTGGELKLVFSVVTLAIVGIGGLRLARKRISKPPNNALH